MRGGYLMLLFSLVVIAIAFSTPSPKTASQKTPDIVTSRPAVTIHDLRTLKKGDFVITRDEFGGREIFVVRRDMSPVAVTVDLGVVGVDAKHNEIALDKLVDKNPRLVRQDDPSISFDEDPWLEVAELFVKQ